jgi:dipeptidyl aminopeptidase/acylaminoacyl peptidase
LIVAASLSFAAPAAAVYPGSNGFLVASGAIATKEGLFTFRPDGGGLGHLVGTEGMQLPSWSSNGRRLAFSAKAGDNEDVYLIQPDGSVVRVTSDLATDRDPAFSPNGQQLVFVSNREGNDELYVIDVDGANTRRLTNNTVSDTQPTWSSTGSIAFTRQEVAGQPATEIMMINADGTGEKQLTQNPKAASDPNFSGDGTKLIFTRGAEDALANDEIWRIDIPTGLNLMNMTNTETTDEHDGVFSPDGGRIAFLRGDVPSEIDVFSISSMTLGEQLLIDNTSLDALDWQPQCDTCNTATTLDVKYKGDKLSAKGSVTPNKAGQSVTVILYEQSGRKLRKVSRQVVQLNAKSEYSALIRRVNGGKCKVKAVYLGDNDSFGSKTSTPLFPC